MSELFKKGGIKMNKKTKKLLVGLAVLVMTLFTGSLVYANTMPNYQNQDDRFEWGHREQSGRMFRHNQQSNYQTNHCHNMMYNN